MFVLLMAVQVNLVHLIMYAKDMEIRDTPQQNVSSTSLDLNTRDSEFEFHSEKYEPINNTL